MGNCLNCSAPLDGAFCRHCGQSAREGRLQASALLHEAIEGLTNFDTRLLRTVRALTTRPGALCLEYVQGRRAAWFPPLRYFLAMLALALLVMLWVGFDPVRIVVDPAATGDPRLLRVRAAVAQSALRHLDVAMALLAPLYAWVLRWLFRRSGFNYAEVGVFALYTLGHCLLLSLLLEPLKFLLLPAAIGVRLGFQWIYTAWAARVFFAVGTWEALWRSFLATLGYLVLQNVVVLLLAVPAVVAAW